MHNNNYKDNKTLGYSLILDVNPNIYSRNNPKNWVIQSLYARLRNRMTQK